MVSIFCITYNHAPYIRQCLEGFVIQKTDFLVEVLVHDDASTDGTADIVRGYEAKYPDLIRAVYQTENQRSKGKFSWGYIIPHAKGKYIALCEGDDYWTDPYKLQKQVNFMEAHPKYALCGHNAVNQDAVTGNSMGLFNEIKSGDLTMEDIIKTWCMPTAGMLFKKELLCKFLSVWENWMPQGDIVLQMICLREGKCRYFSEPMSVYRRNVPGSASVRAAQDKLKYLYGHRLLWKKMDKELDYKYTHLIKKKIRYTNKRIIYEKPPVKQLRFVYRMIKKIVKTGLAIGS